jgi:hypothetical protein
MRLRARARGSVPRELLLYGRLCRRNCVHEHRRWQLLPPGWECQCGRHMPLGFLLHGRDVTAAILLLPAGPLLPRELDERDGRQLRTGIFVCGWRRSGHRVHVCGGVVLPPSIVQLPWCVLLQQLLQRAL